MPHVSPSAKWGNLLPTSSYFPGSPSLSFLYLEVGRWEIKIGEGGKGRSHRALRATAWS